MYFLYFVFFFFAFWKKNSFLSVLSLGLLCLYIFLNDIFVLSLLCLNNYIYIFFHANIKAFIFLVFSMLCFFLSVFRFSFYTKDFQYLALVLFYNFGYSFYIYIYTMVPWYHGTMVPWYHGRFFLFFSAFWIPVICLLCNLFFTNINM